jgi:rubrerythrin
MASRTVRDIITQIRSMHRQLGNLYQTMGDAAARERVKLLLYYVSRHERNLEEALSQYQQQAKKGVLDTWYKSAAGDPVAEFMDPVRITPDMSTDAVVQTVLEADQKLVDQFRRLAENGPSEDVRELFQKLIAIEEREEHLLVRDAAELEDV